MARDRPHPHARFSLVPHSERAKATLRHPANAHRLSNISDDPHSIPTYALDVGFHIGSESRYTLATIGRSGDIVVEGADISRIQCSFEVPELNQDEVMLQDRSSLHNTQFHGETAVSFEPGRIPRRVVIDPSINLLLGFGGAGCDSYLFRIVWHDRLEVNVPKLISFREDNPRLARTVVDEDPTTMTPSDRATRLHIPASENLQPIRYSTRRKLGRGAFGEVYSVINIDTGKLLAVKKVKRPDARDHHGCMMLQREIDALTAISHKHIIEYLQAELEEEHVLIFMEHKTGNVEQLIRQNMFVKKPALVETLLHEMLQALDYLSYNGIIHRDVKPANILFDPVSHPGEEERFTYKLADFGIVNIASQARTCVGTDIYRAPEVKPDAPQTTKVDIWSLFVTVACALDAGGFQGKRKLTQKSTIEAIQAAANTTMLQHLRPMAEIDPNQRASAADILTWFFRGVGRTTPSGANGTPGPGPGGMFQGPAKG
ncbi:unnamed protein product [Clonostachys byssicola]|uniref:mitogen-activated protein kinase n=1 Tax=Clonostachys byssicola TaxID=160290 RepID=A0A9N9U7C6_9HYPO|nr:unnamed protein product [Clonostachys byssicola]